jgi:hypothetical protein
VWDARGNLIEPHTNKQVPLGTLEVRDYIAGGASRYIVQESHGGWATCGPDDRFGAVLFVEKEGFMPLFRVVELAEHYDLAIMSTKGLSTTAARQLVDHLVGEKKGSGLLHPRLRPGRVQDRRHAPGGHPPLLMAQPGCHRSGTA